MKEHKVFKKCKVIGWNSSGEVKFRLLEENSIIFTYVKFTCDEETLNFIANSMRVVVPVEIGASYFDEKGVLTNKILLPLEYPEFIFEAKNLEIYKNEE